MSSTFELALAVHQKWQMYLAICLFLNVFNLWIGTWRPSKVTDVLSNSLISECLQPLNWHLTSIKSDRCVEQFVDFWMSSTFELAFYVHQKWQMYLASRWFLNVLNFWIGTWCPSKVAYVFSNSLICECLQPLNWHLMSIKSGRCI
jgi:hypothetical protein